MGVGMILASRINSVWEFYLCYGILAAIGSSGLYVPVMGAVSKFFSRQRNMALAITGAGSGVGQFLIPPLMQGIIERRGWPASFMIIGIIILLLGVGLPLIFLAGRALPDEVKRYGTKDKGETDRFDPPESIRQYSLRQAMATLPFWAYFTMYFIICFVIDGTIFVHLYPHLTDLGFSGQTAANALGNLGLISTIAMIGFSPLGDRWDKRFMLMGFMAAHTLLLIWLIHLHGPVSLWLFILFYGIVLGAAWPLTVSILADIFGAKSVGSILGACTIAFGLAGLVAPWLAGYIFDRYHSYTPIFYFTILLSSGSAVSVFFTRKTKRMT
jgi:MFS family permease